MSEVNDEELIEERDIKRKEANDAEALADLLRHPGFGILVGIYKDMFDVYFEKIQEADDPDARAGIKNLQELFSQIDSKLHIGEDARKQLSREIFKNLGNT